MAAVRATARPLTGSVRDYAPLLAQARDAKFVLLGEETHGTREFFRERARITRRLIEDRKFSGVVLEAEWPDAERVDRYVRGRAGADATAEAALGGFDDFPRWMWRNATFRDFVVWLRAYNAELPPTQRVGVYGMDLYSLDESIDAVVEFRDRGGDAAAASRARERYGCFAPYRGAPDSYGYAAAENRTATCDTEAAAELRDLLELQRTSNPSDELLSAVQNARVVKNAEAFYRAQHGGKVSSWNVRDRHMADSLDALAAHFRSQGRHDAVAAWAHNSHVGDARATDLDAGSAWNVGQLTRQRHPRETYLIGFTTYRGTVTAAQEWGREGKLMRVRRPAAGSYGAIFHAAGRKNFLLLVRGNTRIAKPLGTERLQRAIGVVYVPASERFSHYFTARLTKQFDAVVHWDVSSAVKPLP